MPAAEDQYSEDDHLDSGLHDSEQLEEIQLMSDLIIAASRRRRAGLLPQHEIDTILGVDRAGTRGTDEEPAAWLPAPRTPGEDR